MKIYIYSAAASVQKWAIWKPLVVVFQVRTSVLFYLLHIFRAERVWSITPWYKLLSYTFALFPLLIGVYSSQVWSTYGVHSCVIYLFFQIIKPKITLEIAHTTCHLDKFYIVASSVSHHLALATFHKSLSFSRCLFWQSSEDQAYSGTAVRKHTGAHFCFPKYFNLAILLVSIFVNKYYCSLILWEWPVVPFETGKTESNFPNLVKF